MTDVSVVVPTFRRPRLLGEAVRSALSQQDVGLEVLVVDDSPEGSAQAEVDSLADPRVRYRRMERPSGGRPALVRNAGWPLATGRYVHFLDDDDRLADGAYAALVAALERRPEVGIAFGRVEPFGEDPGDLRHNQELFAESTRRARLSERIHSRYALLSSMLFCNPCLACSACLIRREKLAELGGFDAQMTPFEDAEMFIRGIRCYGATFVDRPILRYRTGIPSLMHDLAEGVAPAAYRQIYRKYAAEHGRVELFAMQVLARTLLRRV
ncbi:MAG TPA: glycosyltransferase family 2 protein [Gemmatimonadales bacterium]